MGRAQDGGPSVSDFRLLLCVDGSQAALEAARFALDLASEHGGEIRAVSVLEDDETARRLERQDRSRAPASERLAHSVRVVLERIAAMAADRGVPVETQMLEGEPLREIMRDARAWSPELIIIGRTGRSGPGSPMLGSLAMQLLEFTEWPVVVVPEADPSSRRRD